MGLMRNISFKNKLTGIVLFVTFISVAFCIVIVILSSSRAMKKNVRKNAIINTKLVGRYCLEALLEKNEEKAAFFLSQLNAIPTANRGIIFDGNGQEFAVYSRGNNVHAMSYDEAVSSINIKDNVLRVMQPVAEMDTQHGTIYVEFSTVSLYAQLRNNIITMVIVGFVLMSFAYLLTIRVQGILSKPILHLAKITEKISEKPDYSMRVRRNCNDELSKLYEGFNTMLHQMQIREIQRDEAERELRESKESLSLAIEGANLGLWDWNLKTGAVTLNEKWPSMLGHNPDIKEIKDDQWKELIHEEDLSKISAEYNAILFDNKDSIEVEMRVKINNGDWNWIYISGKVIEWDEKNKPRRASGIMRNIDADKQIERIRSAIFRISEAAFTTVKLQDLYSSIHDIISELMRADNLFIALYDKDAEMIHFPYFVDERKKTPPPRKLQEGKTSYVIKSGAPLLASKGKLEVLNKSAEIAGETKEYVDWLGVPLKNKGKTIGVLTVKSYTEGHRYSEDDLNILMFVSTQIAMVIGRKQAEEQIRRSLQEKEVLLKEIHHRVKNNMQVISSMLNLQSAYIEDKQALDMFNDSQNRVKSMALIHEKLYQSRDLARVDFSEYVDTLTNHLFRFYDTHNPLISLRTDVDSIMIGVDMAIPCGLILNELVSNSLKHAFPNNEKGKIMVSFFSNNGSSTLSVRDNGIGFPQDVDFRDMDSLGLQLVNTLVQQIEGEIKLISRKKGTEFTITFDR